MKHLIDRCLFFAMVAVVAALTVTAIPSLTGHPLGGNILLLHMGASGALVFLLPLFGVSVLLRHIQSDQTSSPQRIGYWAALVTGLLTIATVFLCMLPIPNTDQMETLIQMHGYAGYALAFSVVVLAAGTWSHHRNAANKPPAKKHPA